MQPASGATVQQLDEILRREGARRVGAIEKLNVYIAEVAPGRNAAAVVVALRRHPLIAFAELDAAVPPAPDARAQ